MEYPYDFPHTCEREANDNRGNLGAFGPSDDEHQHTCLQKHVCPHHTCGVNCSDNCVQFTCTACPTTAADELLLHAKMYEIADKYDVVGLKELVQEKFKMSSAVLWNHETFPVAANYAFSTTMAEDKGLRDIVSATISEHMELLQKAEIQVMLDEHNGLAKGILLRKADEHGWGKKAIKKGSTFERTIVFS